MAEIDSCYIGQAECGCYVAVVVDRGDERTAKDISDFVKDGMTISRHLLEDFRAGNPPFGHKCGKERNAR